MLVGTSKEIKGGRGNKGGGRNGNPYPSFKQLILGPHSYIAKLMLPRFNSMIGGR